jgi:hypothetical protein
MNATRFPLGITLATAAAAVLLSAAQFAAIHSLAAPQRQAALAIPAIDQLPLVVVVGSSRAGAAAEQLPTVVVTGHAERTLARTATAPNAI